MKTYDDLKRDFKKRHRVFGAHRRLGTKPSAMTF